MSKRKRSLQRIKLNMLEIVDKSLEFLPGYSQVRDVLSTIYRNAKTKDFDEFILSIDKNLKGSEKDKERILKRFEKQESDSILAGIIESAIFSKSSKSRLVLGIIAAKHLRGELIDYEDMVIISALRILLDEELALLFKILANKGKDDAYADVSDYDNTIQRVMLDHLANMNVFNTDVIYFNAINKDNKGIKKTHELVDDDSSGLNVSQFTRENKGFVHVISVTKVTQRLMEYLERIM
ncbi:MAG: hypothetical protein GX921_01320 [Bacteroidales bacterium]|jgi:hypothetical protein|nr:hypothetical protein [Bacteroidales bacterium]